MTLVLAWPTLILLHRETHPVVPASKALAHVLADRDARALVSGTHWTRFDVTAVDPRYELLGFYRGPRLVATVGVGWAGKVVVLDQLDVSREKYAYGSNIANDVRVLIGLCAVFILMMAVWPLARIRNLDVAVCAAFTASIVLFNHWMLDRVAVVSYPALAYLAARCAWAALGPQRPRREAVPLYEYLTRRWSPLRRLRLLRLIAASCVLIVVMVGLTSLHLLDVVYAVTEGATAVIHGVLPYGHVGDVLHGDTYPIGSYLLYAPFAAIWPIHTQWDDADFTLVVAVLAAVAAAWGISRLARSSRRHGGDAASLRGAIAWMTFPPLLVAVSTGTTDAVLAALLVGALLLWRRPAGGTAVLSFAVWFKLVPLVLLPVWLASLRRRSLAAALLAVLTVSVAMLAVVVALGGFGGAVGMLSAMSFQLSREAPHTPWTMIGSVPLQQLAQALTLSLLAAGTLAAWRDRAFAADRVRFAALGGALLLGLQISGNYWTFMYLPWAFPFIALSLLHDREE